MCFEKVCATQMCGVGRGRVTESMSDTALVVSFNPQDRFVTVGG